VTWYLLLFLVPIGIGAYLVWDHKRKVAEREAASAERLNALLAAAPHIPTPTQTPLQKADVSAPMVETIAATASPAPPAASYVVRERILSPPETLLYYLLKTGLPECHVFAHVALRAVLDAAPSLSGYARNDHERRVTMHAVDFLVCDRSLRPMAVVELERIDEPNGTAGARQSWIGSAGLRYLTLPAKALPKKEALRALVLGEVSAEAQNV
jgi:hypothetical protein